jgi:uncharacterized protein (DUF885 family)
MRIAVLLVVLVLTPILTAQDTQPTFPAPAVGASSTSLHQQFTAYWEFRLAESPELATQVGRTEYNDRWRDWSKAARDRARIQRREFLEQMLYIGTGNLTVSERMSAHLLEHELRTELDAEPYLRFVERVSQMRGAHNEVFVVIDQMPARTVKDYENIIARLRAVPRYVDQSIDLMREQLAAGLAQPAGVVDLILDQLAAQSRPSAEASPLLAAFGRFPEDISAADQARLRTQAVAAYQQQFVPSWNRLESFFRDTYRRQVRPQIGIGSIGNGANAYRLLARTYTTTRMTPEEIHQLGLQEVARIDGEMERIAREAGFTGPATAYEQRLKSRAEMRYASQDEMLAHAREVLNRLEPEMPRFFRRVPRAAVGVRPIAPDREASTASNYTAGTPDGARQAWFNMNTYRPEQQSKYVTEALVIHETVPGHHLQVGLARELEGVPEFRRVFSATAFSEGWALYAESLGPEIGTVYKDPAMRFGQLASEKFRAVRLVVDTGMHALGWSRERALEYFTLHVPGQSVAEVDRYIAWPGQALAYKVGELKIKELRRRAEKALGSRFDVREFHDAVLRNGTVPLDMLEEQVESYIERQRHPV